MRMMCLSKIEALKQPEKKKQAVGCREMGLFEPIYKELSWFAQFEILKKCCLQLAVLI